MKLADMNLDGKEEEQPAENAAEQPKMEPKRCVFCGTDMEADAVFCPNCGQKND